MTIAAYDELATVEDVHKQAMKLWKLLYKAPRKRHVRLTRAPPGFLTGSKTKSRSFKSWIQKRRDNVGAFAKSVARVPMADAAEQAAGLSVLFSVFV